MLDAESSLNQIAFDASWETVNENGEIQIGDEAFREYKSDDDNSMTILVNTNLFGNNQG